MSNLTAANLARIENQLNVVLDLAEGPMSIRQGIASGKLTSLYYRPFETRKDSYGIMEQGEDGFYDIPKMLHEHLAEQGMDRFTWGA